MNPDFYDWLQERYKHKTISNYLRALRHLEREGVNLDSKDSFREWILKAELPVNFYRKTI